MNAQYKFRYTTASTSPLLLFLKKRSPKNPIINHPKEEETQRKFSFNPIITLSNIYSQSKTRMPPLHYIESLKLLSTLSSWTSEDEDEFSEVDLLPVQKESRRVNFSDNISVQEIPNVPEEYRFSYWMTKEDHRDIRLRVSNEVHAAVSRCATHSGDFRGLEHKTPTGIYRRKQNRQAAINAVLQEQEFQMKTGYEDPDGIASVYREISSKSLVEAKLMGMRDEIAIKNDVLLHEKQNLLDFKRQNFNDFKSMAKSFMMADRLET